MVSPLVSTVLVKEWFVGICYREAPKKELEGRVADD